jgi:hypothetical protein
VDETWPRAPTGHDTAAPPRRLRASLRRMGLPRVHGCAEATCALVEDQVQYAGAERAVVRPV